MATRRTKKQEQEEQTKQAATADEVIAENTGDTTNPDDTEKVDELQEQTPDTKNTDNKRTKQQVEELNDEPSDSDTPNNTDNESIKQTQVEDEKDAETVSVNLTPQQILEMSPEQLSEQIDNLKQQVTEYRAELEKQQQQYEHDKLLAQVEQETGVSRDALRGDTLDELRAHAQQILNVLKGKPTAPAVDKPSETPKTELNDERTYIRKLFNEE